MNLPNSYYHTLPRSYYHTLPHSFLTPAFSLLVVGLIIALCAAALAVTMVAVRRRQGVWATLSAGVAAVRSLPRGRAPV